MNRNFEIAKITSSISGSLILASTLFFGWSSKIQEDTRLYWDSISENKIKLEGVFKEHLVSQLYLQRNIYYIFIFVLAIGILLLFTTIFFLIRGNQTAKLEERKNKILLKS